MLKKWFGKRLAESESKEDGGRVSSFFRENGTGPTKKDGAGSRLRSSGHRGRRGHMRNRLPLTEHLPVTTMRTNIGIQLTMSRG